MSVFRLSTLLATMAAQTGRAAWRLRGLQGAARHRAAAELLHEGARASLRAWRATIRVTGDVPTGGALVVPNHFGLLDAFAVVGAAPMAVAGRADLATDPVLGPLARTYGIISVERERRSATEGFVAEVQARLDAGVPVLVFAEGTTTDGRHLLPLKTGAFEAVAGTPYPVVPVWQRPVAHRAGAVSDLRPFAYYEETMWASFQRLVQQLPAEIAVHFGAPIPAMPETRKTLAKATEAALAALRDADAGLARFDG